MRILVTGATGLLGNNIIRAGLDSGHQVTAIVRGQSSQKPLEGLGVRIVEATLTDSTRLIEAARDADAIVHSAAHIHIGWKFLEQAMEVNVESTKSMIEVARVLGKRLVHVSTVNTLAIPNSGAKADETTELDGQVPCTYVLSKRASEKLVREASAQGVQAMVVHPGFMLGPWDWKPSSGRMILEVAKRWTPVAPSGGCSVCDVRDVAHGVLAAIDRGRPGRNYILGGENLTYFDLWSRFAKQLGKSSPFTILRKPGQLLVGFLGDLISRLGSRESDMNSAAIQMSSQHHWYSSQRAMDELGYNPRPADESIRDAIRWFRENRYL